MHVGRIASCSKDKRAILETNDEKYGLLWKVFGPNCCISTLAKGHRCPKPGNIHTSKKGEIKLKKTRPLNGAYITGGKGLFDGYVGDEEARWEE